MNRALLALLWVSGLLSGHLPAAASLAQVRFQDRDYIRLGEWSARHGLKLSRNPASRAVVVAGPNTRIDLVTDTSRIQFNGTAVWLSYPVVAADGQVLVSVQDVRGVLDALLRPPRLPAGKRIRTICLDPGHGGKQPGNRAGSRLEKTYTLALAQEVRALLVQAGFKVVMTRRSDAFVDHPERLAIAKRQNADLFVSLHFNATADGSSDANGVEVYAMTPEGARSTNVSADVGSLRAWAGNEFDRENVLLAYQVQRALLRRLAGTEDRGVRRARFLVLRLAEMPAVLIEGGFMGNASDARWIYSVHGRKKMAQAIVEGLQTYRQLVEAPPAPSQRSTNSRSSTSKAPPASARN